LGLSGTDVETDIRDQLPKLQIVDSVIFWVGSKVCIFSRFKRRDIMCRNIRPLFNYDPPATDEEIYASALQFVRKISGSSFPSKVNEKVFYETVIAVSGQINQMLERLETSAPPKNREVERERARQRNLKRFPS
jgi:hypothetical protein